MVSGVKRGNMVMATNVHKGVPVESLYVGFAKPIDTDVLVLVSKKVSDAPNSPKDRM